MKRITIKKGEIIQRKGDLNIKAYSLVSGILRGYSIDEKGKEHIFLFAPEDWMIADSVRNGDPADLFIDALENSELIVLEKTISPEIQTDKLLKISFDAIFLGPSLKLK